MRHRTAVAALALSAAALFSIEGHAAPETAAATPAPAADCLAGPQGATPAGKHWFYRLDRATRKKCWYLGDQRTPAATPKLAARKTPAVEIADDDANVDAPLPTPSAAVANARAEYVPATAVEQKAAAGTPPSATPAVPTGSDVWGGSPPQNQTAPDAPIAQAAAIAQAPVSRTPASNNSDPAPVAEASLPPPAPTPAGAASGISFWMLGGGLIAALAIAGFIARLLIGFNAPHTGARAHARRGIADVDLPPLGAATPADPSELSAAHEEMSRGVTRSIDRPDLATLNRLTQSSAAPLQPSSFEDHPGDYDVLRAIPQARDLDAEAAARRGSPAVESAQSSDERVTPPLGWMRNARDRASDVDKASDAIEQLLAMARRPAAT